jgi:uncharacterized peroxidase-related enzyme
MSAEYTLSLKGVDVDSARPREREVLDGALKQVGFIPNMYANMVNAPALLETYLLGYSRFREEAGFTPAEQEVVFLSISFENSCSYCMAAHSTIADNKSKVPVEVTNAIRRGEAIPDVKLRALSELTRTLVAKRGLPAPADVQPFLAAGYTERQILYVVLAIAVKTLSNYSNHLFDTEVDAIFAKRAWHAPEVGEPADV